MSDLFDQEALVHAEALHRFALRLCANPHDAEDLLQEAFLSAFRSFHQYKPGTNCKSWLFRIMHNAFRKRFRKAESKAVHIAIEEEGGEFILHQHMLEKDKMYADDPEQRLLDLIPSDQMKKALDLLSDDYRSVLLLCDVEDLSYQEAADVLELPIGTVRSRLSRARSSVQRALIVASRS